MLVDEEKQWGMLSHLSLFVLMIVGPLIIMQTLGKRSAYVRYHAADALNFQITLTVASVVTSVLFTVILLQSPSEELVIGYYVLLLALFVAMVVLPIRAAIRAHRGQLYRYPLTLPLVRRGPVPVEPSGPVPVEPQEPRGRNRGRLYSLDGRWWWNGQEWQRVPQQAAPPLPSEGSDRPGSPAKE